MIASLADDYRSLPERNQKPLLVRDYTLKKPPAVHNERGRRLTWRLPGSVDPPLPVISALQADHLRAQRDYLANLARLVVKT